MPGGPNLQSNRCPVRMKPVVVVRVFLWAWVAVVVAGVAHALSTGTDAGGLSRVMIVVAWFIAALFFAIGAVMAGLRLENGTALRRLALLPAILHLVALAVMWSGLL